MVKAQHGNKEAKKPKQVRPVTPPAAAIPEIPPAVRNAQGHKPGKR